VYNLTNKQWEIWQPQYKVVPLMRCVLALIFGIFLSGYFKIYEDFSLILIFLFLLIGIVLYRYRKKISEFGKSLYGVLVLLFLFVLGFHLIYLGRDDLKSKYYGNFWSGKQKAIIKILDIPKQGNSYLITRAKVLAVEKFDNVVGDVYVLIKSNDFSESFRVNDILTVDAQLARPLEPANPHQFNFKQYLFNRHLYHEIFIRKENLVSVNRKSSSNVYEKIKNLREQLIQWVKHFDFSNEEFSVANSLLFGYTGDLTEDVFNSYSNTGVMHVLSVSGLHVGIIYMLINMILQRVDASMTTRFRHFLFIASVLWFYAMLSGMSPSIVRSAFMFSLLKLSESFNNRAGSFHTFFACLFAMLLYDANYLFDVGFQLSFCAVYGILYFQPKFNSWFTFTKKYQIKIFELLSITIAAQIVTIPISLFYFHQFPNYFIITNAVIVPLSSMIMIIGLVFITVSAVPYIGNICFYIFKGSIFFMNKVVVLFDSLPFSSVKGVYFDAFYLILLSVAIILLILFLERRNMIYLKLAICSVGLIFLSEFASKIWLRGINKIIFYASNEGFVVEHYKDNTSNFFYERTTSASGTFARTFLQGNRIYNRINAIHSHQISINEFFKSHVCMVGGKTVLIIDSLMAKNYSIKQPFKVDILYLKYFHKKLNTRFFKKIDAEYVILDKKIDYRARKYLKRNTELFGSNKISDLKEHSFSIEI
jgi:competence protein ComEC